MNPSVNIYIKWGALSLLLLLSSSGALLGQTVQGMDNERLYKIDGLIENHIKEQHIPGGGKVPFGRPGFQIYSGL